MLIFNNVKKNKKDSELKYFQKKKNRKNLFSIFIFEELRETG